MERPRRLTDAAVGRPLDDETSHRQSIRSSQGALMRASVSFFLALLFAVTPISQVHGQARQQGPSPPDSNAVIPPPVGTRSLVVLEPVWAPWVPTLEASNPTDRLLAPGVTGLWDTTDSLPVLEPAPISTSGKIAIVVGVLLAAAIMLLILVALEKTG